jgi:predicted amidohydrolase YtcJ
MTTRAEIIFTNGTIHTMDPHSPTAEAMAVAGGRVTAIGQPDAVEATTHANTRRVDLEGRTVIPGFNDANIGLAPDPGQPDLENAFFAAAKSYVKFGITNITEAGLSPEQLDIFRIVASERRLPLRVNAVAQRYSADGAKIPLPERSETNWLRIDTVRLTTQDQNGKLRLTDDQLRAMVWDIHRAGLRAAIQAESEAAIEQAIGAIEYASSRLVSRIKHRIEPFSNPTDAQLQRCRQHAINVVIDPSQSSALVSKLLAAQIKIAFGSRAQNAQDTNPLVHLKAAAANVDVTTLLTCYTLGAAQVAAEDHLKGSLVPGKYADFVILSGDPFRAPVDRLTDLQVEATYVNGLAVFTRSQN